MSPIVELVIADPPLFGEIFDGVPGARATIEDVHYFSEGGDSHYVIFWWVSECDFETFERTARAYEYTCDLQELTALEERRLYRITTTPLPEEWMLFPFFRRHDITTLDGEVSDEGLRLRLRLADREDLRTLVEKVESIDADPHVERIYTSEDSPAADHALTERQCEVIQLALDRGYFESPSEVTLEELAADREVTPQTLSKHIRSGIRKIVARQVNCAGPRHEPVEGDS